MFLFNRKTISEFNKNQILFKFDLKISIPIFNLVNN